MRDLDLQRCFVIYRGTDQRKLAANVWALPSDDVAGGSLWPWQFRMTAHQSGRDSLGPYPNNEQV